MQDTRVASYSLRQSPCNKMPLEPHMGPHFPRTVTLLSSLPGDFRPQLLFSTLIQVEVKRRWCWQPFQTKMNSQVLTKNRSILTSSIWTTFCVLCNVYFSKELKCFCI